MNCCKDKSYPPNQDGTTYIKCGTCGRDLADKPQRSISQNKSIHLWLEWLADELNKQGVTIQDVVSQIKKAEIRPTKENLKETMWKPMQMALFNKESSTELTTDEVDKVYEMLNAFLPQIPGYDGVSIPFPNAADQHLVE